MGNKKNSTNEKKAVKKVAAGSGPRSERLLRLNESRRRRDVACRIRGDGGDLCS